MVIHLPVQILMEKRKKKGLMLRAGGGQGSRQDLSYINCLFPDLSS